jgi:hypothetical protein
MGNFTAVKPRLTAGNGEFFFNITAVTGNFFGAVNFAAVNRGKNCLTYAIQYRLFVKINIIHQLQYTRVLILSSY